MKTPNEKLEEVKAAFKFQSKSNIFFLDSIRFGKLQIMGDEMIQQT